jgi:hypothetical protein
LEEAVPCAAFGDEHYPNDMPARIESYDSLVSSYRGSGLRNEYRAALEIRLGIARTIHLEGGAPPTSALADLAEEVARDDDAAALLLFLEAWAQLESDPEADPDLRRICAQQLVRLYTSTGDPSGADPYRTWAEEPAPNPDLDSER